MHCALTLLVEWQEGHPTCKNLLMQSLRVFSQWPCIKQSAQVQYNCNTRTFFLYCWKLAGYLQQLLKTCIAVVLCLCGLLQYNTIFVLCYRSCIVVVLHLCGLLKSSPSGTLPNNFLSGTLPKRSPPGTLPNGSSLVTLCKDFLSGPA